MIARIGFIAAIAASHCQAQQPLVTIELTSPAVFTSVDRPGDLYVGLASGEIRKFDKDGKLLGSLVVPQLDLFEAGDGTRSFGFIRDRQEVLSIAYDLGSFQAIPVHPEFAVSPWLVCPSRNEHWILDSADVSLKKTKERITAIGFESLWSSRPLQVNDISYMREYLNFLFILENGKGIHILNTLGREIRTIGEPAITSFNFLGEELYFRKGTTLQLIDLYTAEKREIPLPSPATFVALTDERMMLVDGRRLSFYAFKP